jgi:TPR repeat protein
LFQSLRAPADADEEDWEYGPQRSSPYRYYIAAALAIIILGLGYLAWRSAQSSQAANEVSPAPPAAATENAPASTTPAPAPKTETAPTSPARIAAPDAAKTTAATSNSTEKQRPTEVVRASETRRIEPRAASASIGGGTEELATAQRYLNGTGGQGRDSAEAAKWLWKSIAKHNGQATLLLADLYLRGDGVSKNCEQGRVLLDSAAQRGIPGAGERLRNLPAFGCH